ncbi:flagellar motor protein MotB [Rosenbergiella nectarea]|uniref:flagellar motor protein MotB n=1 Tax=Rosenbergiella nectarea TaxID=988801 RepID=UPI001BD95AE6|nr:flagellar motor protein MotB [Rosenbergiella nectarea]MBT0730485.1 OmpA family protein [Rosenbergiella nectarea subsp. apis]
MSGRQKGHTTIIKRSSRRAHAGGHGGAWKVAFADFMLALMSLFMVMWIMGQVPEKDRKAIMYTLNNQSIFDSHSYSPISFSAHAPAPANAPEVTPSAVGNSTGSSQSTANLSTNQPKQASAKQSDAEQRQLQQALQSLMIGKQAQSNMRIERLAQGIRVVVNDDQHRMMFERGSAKVTTYFQQLLASLVPALKQSGSHLMIIGHTDATPYQQNPFYDNWSLSVNRAQSARQVLIRAGMESDKIIQISGVADKKLLDPQQPANAINRRIEFIILSAAGLSAWEKSFAMPAAHSISASSADK